MTYQHRVLDTGSVFAAETNGVWSFADLNGDGNPDLAYIKTANTASNKIEVHGSYSTSGFKTRAKSTASGFVLDSNGTWLMQDYSGDGKADLVFIKTKSTGQSKVEVHVADASTDYQNVNIHIVTGFACEDNGIWTMTANGEYLVYIKTKNTASKKVELHAVSKQSSYTNFTHHIVTDFDLDPLNNGTFVLAPAKKLTGKVPGVSGAIGDLFFIKSKATGSAKVEVHAVTAESGWKIRSNPYSTVLTPEQDGVWSMVDYSHATHPDLGYIKTRNTSTGTTEVHIVAFQ